MNTLRDWITPDEDTVDDINEELPAWLEQKSILTMAKTDRGKTRLERLAFGVPESVYRRWSKLSVTLAGVLLVAWVGVIAITTSFVFTEVVSYIVSLEWIEALLSPPEQPEINPIETLVSGATFYLMYLLLFVVLLPGIILHEFGHFMSFVRNGCEVESYGLLFVGPIPLGAFVAPDDSDAYVDTNAWREIVSAGIINNIAWGLILITVALLTLVTTSATPGAIIDAYVHGNTLAGTGNRVVLILFVLGAMEVLMGASNAAPVPKFDGGHFAKSVLIDWWGFNEVFNEVTPSSE